ncbi:MAG: IS1182 family transposase [Desulfobulbia bacterium]
MAKFKRYNYSQSILVPVSLEKQLMPSTLEFAIHTLVESYMDLSVFDDKYNNDQTGRSAYDPKVLLKVVLLAYSRGLISSRKIEQACRENIIFMALACGQYPDHSTIAAFVSSMQEQILPLFRDVLLVCDEQKLLGGTFFALDGCKLPSSASKEWSGKISDLKKKKAKIEQRVQRLLNEQIESDNSKINEPPDQANHERQVQKIRHQAERIEKWLNQNGPRIGANGKEIQSNVTDYESAKMHTSHGTVQGYNGQALVDKKHQVILHAEAFGCGQDHGHLDPMLDGAKKNIQAIGQPPDYFKGKILTADTNYHSHNNIEKCIEEEVDAYIPDLKFRRRDPRFATQKRYQPQKEKPFRLEDFKHDQTKDQYICPNGQPLKVEVKKGTRDRIIYRRYVSNVETCRACALKYRCIRNKNGKRKTLIVPIGYTKDNYSKAMAEKVDGATGRRIYPQRIAIVEPVFANIRTHKQLNRFTLRGKAKVNIQWMLYCIIHNICKIKRYATV